jgi:hypothetical protein
MRLQEFSEKYNLLSKKETEKIAFIAFYHLHFHSQIDFTIPEVKAWFDALHFPEPNSTRVRNSLVSPNGFTKGQRANSFKLHAKKIKEIFEACPDIAVHSVDVDSDGSILPNSLLDGKRSYIQQFGKQINSAYTNNIFDGCAVLMRRMVEVCLIHTYENFSIDGQIKNETDKYKDLKEIIKDAKTNPAINLTPDSKACLDEFRELGNLSAHQLYYNCKQEEINRVKQKFRLLIEEFFNKAGRKVEK